MAFCHQRGFSHASGDKSRIAARPGCYVWTVMAELLLVHVFFATADSGRKSGASKKTDQEPSLFTRSSQICLCPFTWKFPWRGCCYAAGCFIGIHILVTFSRVPSEFDSFAWEFAHPLRRYPTVISPEFINRSVINFVYILTSIIEKSNRIMFSLFTFHKKYIPFLCINYNSLHRKWQKINMCPFILCHSHDNCKIQEGGF